MKHIKAIVTTLLLAPFFLSATTGADLINNDPPNTITGEEITIECPPDIVVSCLSQVPEPQFSMITVIGSCEPDDYSLVHGWDEWIGEDDICSGQWTIQREFHVIDPCEQYAQCFQYITIHDTVPPIFSETPENDTLICTDAIEPVIITAMDECGDEIPVMVEEVFDFDTECPIAYQIHHTINATDLCGNTNTHSFTTSYVDNDPPIIVPFDEDTIQIACDDLYDIPEPIIFETCSAAEVEITSDSIPGDCYGSVVYTYTATEPCGNTSSQTFTVQFTDETAPVIDLGGLEDGGTLPCDLQIGIEVPTAQDNCSGEVPVTMTGEQIPGGCPNSYTEIMTFTAVDDCGNETSETISLNFVDEFAPEFTQVPDDWFFECIDVVPAPDPNLLSAIDNCGEVTITHMYDEQEGGECEGVVYRTYRATDECDNFTDYVQAITLIDDIAPVLNGVPTDLTLSCEEEVPAPAEVTATDNCDDSVNVVFSETTEAGQCPQEETIIRTWTAIDSCGNEVSAAQTLFVYDDTDPVITSCPAETNYDCIFEIPEPNTELIAASDNCGDVYVLHLGDELDGDECARTIIRTYRVYDECENFTDCVQSFEYNDNVAPVFDNPPQNITVDCANVPDPMNIEASDNCSLVTIQFNDTEFNSGCQGIGLIERVWTAIDQCGNEGFHFQYITILDTLPPVFQDLPDDTTYSCYEEIPGPADVTATDNCNVSVEVMYSDSIQDGECPQEYSIFRTWTATDTCENIVAHTQVITIVDEEAPVFSMKDTEITLNCGDELQLPEPTANDNCNKQIEYNMAVTTASCVEVYTWTATDQCSNSSEVALTVNYIDEGPPEFTSCPNDTTYNSLDDVPAPDISLLLAQDSCSTEINYAHIEDEMEGDDCVGSISRHYSATDECGNSAICTQTITYFSGIDTTVIDSGFTLYAIQPDATFQWIDCNNNEPIPGATDATFSPEVDGSYAVIIELDSCTETSACYKIVGVGIDDIQEQALFSVYPNPNDGRFLVEMNSASEIAIYDISGRLVLQQRLKKGRSTINLSDFSNGMYLMTGNNMEQVFSERIIINR